MKIGEVIRKYRKEKQMTQEEVAGYLGVTAPAVNKWENGNSFPDITLLAPIARLFGISTDTLLSYKEDLTDEEVNHILEEISSKMQEAGFDCAFQLAEEKIREYPNCISLIFRAMQLIESYRLIYGMEKTDEYDEKLRTYYERSLESADYEIVQEAAVFLFLFYLTRKDYEEAEKCLERIPTRNPVHPLQLKASLYVNQGKYEDASSLYERILFTDFTEIYGALNGLLSLAVTGKDISKAERIAEKQKQLAIILEMGKYYEVMPGMELALQRQDREETLRCLEKIVESMHHLDMFCESELYAHMTFGNVEVKNIAMMLMRGIEESERTEYIREDDRYLRLMEKLKKMSEDTCK